MFGSRYVVGSPNTWNETSSSLRGATYGMQNTLELRHSRLEVGTQKTSSALRVATLSYSTLSHSTVSYPYSQLLYYYVGEQKFAYHRKFSN